MRLSSDRLDLLLSYGLSRLQAKAYLALVQYPEVTAGELAKAARIPRNRLYDILTELQGMGLVHIFLGAPRRYRANPISSYLDRQVEEMAGRIEEMRSRRDLLDALFRPPVSPEAAAFSAGATRVVLGRRAVAREAERLLAAATREVVAVASRGGIRRLAGYLKSGLPDRANRLRLELVLPPGVTPEPALASVGERVAVTVRRVPTALRLSGFVVDGTDLLAVQAMPDDDRLTVGDDFAILTTNVAIVQDYLNLLRLAGGEE